MSDNCDGVPPEVLQDQHKLTIELLQTVIENQQRSDILVARIPKMADDITAIKVAVRGHTEQLKALEDAVGTHSMPARD